MKTAPLLIAGGGLFGGLFAFHLSRVRPDWSVCVLEKAPSLGGHHTWSFHGSDLGKGVSGEMRESLRLLTSKTWEGTEVRFPKHTRVLSGEYHSLRSEDFHPRVSAALGDRLRLGAEILELRPEGVLLRSGEHLAASFVVDARGFRHASQSAARCGFQKFTGLDVRLAEPHGLVRPLLMDATCEQTDGFRFFYLLPWDETRLLIEDTRYSESDALSSEEDEREILTEVARRGWTVAAVERRERGVLPIPYYDDAPPSVSTLGVRGGDFHEVTGYSLASAVQLIDRLAQLRASPGTPAFQQEWEATVQGWRASRRARSGYYRLLNRMLFFAADPQQRYRVLERFYTLSEPLIRRFYAGESTLWDRTRILLGRPPVPVLRAIPCLSEAWSRRAQKSLKEIS